MMTRRSSPIALFKATHPAATPTEVKSALQAAGTLDWFTATDPDATHERLLNVASFGAAADFSLTASPASASVKRGGGTATYTIDAARTNGYSSDIALTVSGLPSGATASFLPQVLQGPGGVTSTLTVNVPRTTATATYVLTIMGTSTAADATSRSTTVTLVKR